jgi:hypothetical protein
VNDGIQSGDFLERLQGTQRPFWRPIFRSWLLAGGTLFWLLIAAKIVRFVAGVWL